MNDFIIWFTNLAGQFRNGAYIVLALAAFLEALPVIGFFVPGVVALVVTGFLVASGVFDFGSALVIAAVAGVAGDIVGFAFAKRFKSFFNTENRFFKKEYLVKAEKFSGRFGGGSIFIGRFLGGPVRSVISLVAGVSKMSWLRFLILCSLGSFIFSVLYIGLGYFLNSAWRAAATWSSRPTLIFAALVISAVLLWWLKRFVVKQGKDIRQQLVEIIQSVFTQLRPRLNPFFAKHLNPGRFAGLPQSALVILAVVFLIVSWVIACSITTQAGVWLAFDLRLLATLNLFASGGIAAAALLISLIASTTIVFAIGVGATLWFVLEKRKSHIIGFWISVLGSMSVVSIMKFIIARPRPTPTLYFENFYAYPSMHAAFALALFGYLAYYLIRSYPRWSRNVSIVLWTGTLALAIGVSRVYLGVHYASDIIGGFLVAGAALISAIVVQRALEKLDEPRHWKKKIQVLFASAIGFVLLGLYLTAAFDRGPINELYEALPAHINEQRTLDELFINHVWPSTTENLSGARELPINYVFQADLKTIEGTLYSMGWLTHESPTLTTILARGTSALMGTPYLKAPLPPRFWLNEPNIVSLTKAGADGTIYALRLWRAPRVGAAFYIAELSVDREFSLSGPSKAEALEQGRTIFLEELASHSLYSGLERIIIQNSDEKYQVIYIINLRN